jgi:drug/metabolite transporter (DMT)-like permease
MLPDPSPKRAARSALLVAIAAVLFALMAIVAKQAAARLPGPEVACVRFLVGLAMVGVVATRRRLRAHNWRGLFLRGAFGGAAVLCYFLAIEHLPVGFATLLNYTAPVFTALWAAIFLREPIGRAAVGALAVTTAGVALVIVGQRENAPPGTYGFGPWQLVGVLSAVLSGAAVATIREVRRTDGSWEIFASFCVVGALVTGVPAAPRWVTPTGAEWGWLAAVGLISVVAQIMMTYALRDVRAALTGIIMQLTPVAAIVLGALLFGERAHGLQIAGAAVTLVGVSWGGWIASAPPSRGGG